MTTDLKRQWSTIKGILFDKDGTLIDFQYTWEPIFFRFVQVVSDEYSLSSGKQEVLKRQLGDGNGQLRHDNLFANGTFTQIMTVLHQVVPGFTKEHFNRLFAKAVAQTEVQARPIGAALETLQTLVGAGYHLGVATADRPENTEHTLEAAGLRNFFDFVGSDTGDGRGKPGPHLMEEFCQRYGLRAHEVAMVGDTMTDMKFAANSGAGLSVFVRSSFADPEAQARAQLVLDDLNQLPPYLLGSKGD